MGYFENISLKLIHCYILASSEDLPNSFIIKDGFKKSDGFYPSAFMFHNLFCSEIKGTNGKQTLLR